MAFKLFKTLDVIANIGILAGGAASICNSVSGKKSSYQKDSYELRKSQELERSYRRLEKKIEEISEMNDYRNTASRLKVSYDSEVQKPSTPVYSLPQLLYTPTQVPVQYAQVPVMQSSCTPAYSYPQPYFNPTQVPVQYAQTPAVQPGQMTIQQTAVGQTITMNTNDFIAAIVKALAIAMNNQFSQTTGNNGII